MAPLRRALLDIVHKIFDQGLVTPEQRELLAWVHHRRAFTAAELEDVFQTFLSVTWGDVIDDETLTSDDWRRLALIVHALRLPLKRVPFPGDRIRLAS
jgi:hypothetical protein